MSELDLHGLPPLPPARPMSDEDWDRLHAKVFGTIGAYERRRRVRLLLIAAAVLVVALVAIAAAWELTRPSANSRSDVSISCVSGPAPAMYTAVVPTDDVDPVRRCAQEWAAGAVVPGRTEAPPLAACATAGPGSTVSVVVVPVEAGQTCAAVGYDELAPEDAASAARFAHVQAALSARLLAEDCVPFGRARDTARVALEEAGLDGWEVARDGSYDGGDTCLSFWVFDHDQRLLFLFGTG
jgi:hypothetical protein